MIHIFKFITRSTTLDHSQTAQEKYVSTKTIICSQNFEVGYETSTN